MNDFVLPQASLFLGIIPALILLYISLKGYEGHYKDKNIFLTFVVGLIAGFVSVLLETFTIGIGILFIILFPVIEQL
ncbi:MAG: protease PrsW, partial [Thermoplasmatales archaeon]|nr:protease PrsW [Thermoplasmatales archaeon]